MKISEIYKKYNIPPNLIDHMLTVTKVVLFITNHWKGEKIDKIVMEKSALVHDLGNIVKFNFKKYPEFLGSEMKNRSIWEEKQKEMVAKYGNDDHEATRLILNELKFDDKSIGVVSSKSFGNSVATLNSNNWNLKILLYSDLRVLPWGTGTLEDRFNDIKERMPQYNTRPDLEDLFRACREIERQIQNNVDVSLATIDTKSVKERDEDLLNLEI